MHIQIYLEKFTKKTRLHKGKTKRKCTEKLIKSGSSEKIIKKKKNVGIF